MSEIPRLAAPSSTDAGSAGNSYDEVPYQSYPYAQTHPSRLATLATLFGLTPPPVERCRVLELGCAAGGNIIPMGEMLPESEFVGVDLSARQIADGERIVRGAGLKNVSLHHVSILDIDAAYGTFDYIICHGVFSWVPDAVREKILDTCSKHLRPSGVAYVSYNTYPGWHMRGMIRDMMRYHSMRFNSADARIKQARALLDFLSKSARNDGCAFSTLLRTELETLRHQADHYLYHEHLEDVNKPVYFYEFMSMADRHGLRYLGESRLTTMVSGNFTPEMQRALEIVAADQVQAEQYMDFIRNRTFRETLLVKNETEPNWVIRPEAMRTLQLTTTCRLVDESAEVRSDTTVQYQSKSGMTLSTSSPVIKAAMRVLGERWPGTVSFVELDRAVNEMLGTGGDGGQALATGLMNVYLAADLLEFHAAPIAGAEIGEKPTALASARAQLGTGEMVVANRRHEVFRPTEFECKLIPLLDGTRDRIALVEQLTELTLAKELTVQSEGKTLSDRPTLREALAPLLDQTLAGLANSAMFK